MVERGCRLQLQPISQRSFYQKKLSDNENWLFWRPIVNGVLTYTEASQMHITELLEANAALDRKIADEKKAAGK